VIEDIRTSFKINISDSFSVKPLRSCTLFIIIALMQFHANLHFYIGILELT